MAGNAWEWTGTMWRRNLLQKEPEYKYPYDPQDGREDMKIGEDDRPENVLRVKRGGDSEVAARCAAREWGHPDQTTLDLGFRVALSLF
jgi:formylglycine-generating enzyme required for sulfatase activity